MKFSTIVEEACNNMKEDINLYEQHLDYALEEQKDFISNNEIAIYKSGKKLRPLLLILLTRKVKYIIPTL